MKRRRDKMSLGSRILYLIVLCITSYANPALSKAMPDSFSGLVDRSMPAVVNISSTQTIEANNDPFGMFSFQFPDEGGNGSMEGIPDLLEKFYGLRRKDSDEREEHKATSLGSGFVIDSEGYIVTNNHVIENAEEITVTFSDDTKADAKVVGRDSKTDIALLKVDVGHKLSSVEWGDSDKAKVGDWVIAIGNPFGLGGSVSAGIISARARDINAGPFDDFLQTDAAINRGNSGGPLFNVKGEVIGVNTAIFSPSGGNVGIGFAVPSSLAWPVIQQLKEYGKPHRGWLGVKIQTVTDEIASSLSMNESEGALVVEVTSGSPAAEAGMKIGDVILTFDGRDVPNMRKLPRIVAETKIDKKVVVTILREGKEKTLIVKVAELVEGQAKGGDKDKGGDKPEVKPEGESILGMTVGKLTGALRREYRVDDGVDGVLILDVDSKGIAVDKGIRAGDVIVSADQKAIGTVAAFKKVVEQARDSKKKALLLLLNRRGDKQFIALPFAKK
jgi:serine protease Do